MWWLLKVEKVYILKKLNFECRTLTVPLALFCTVKWIDYLSKGSENFLHCCSLIVATISWIYQSYTILFCGLLAALSCQILLAPLLKYENETRSSYLGIHECWERCCTVLTETGTWGLSSWLPAVWAVSGGQIQRHLPPNSQRYPETTHTAQVHIAMCVYITADIVIKYID